MQSTPFWPWTACFALCLTGCGRTDFASPEVPSASPSTTSLRVSTSSLGRARVGVSFQVRLTAEGGTPPYQWALSTPADLSRKVWLTDATLVGAVDQAGRYRLTVTVGDAAGALARAELPLLVEAPTEPDGPLRITARSPAPDEVDVASNAPVTVQFNAPLDPISEDALEVYADRTRARVEGALSVEDQRLIFSPSEPWALGDRYEVQLDFRIASTSGQLLANDELRRWTFTANARLPDSLSVGIVADYVHYEPTQQRLYVLGQADRRLVVVDLRAKQVVQQFDLVAVPSDLCIEPGLTHAWIVSRGSSQLDRISLQTGEVVETLYWPAPDWGAGRSDSPTHFHIQCLQDELLLADASWGPGLWSVDLGSDMPVARDHSDEIANIGDFVFAEASRTFYYWHQYGWSAGWLGTNVYRVERSEQGQFSIADESDVGYPAGSRDPLDSPIFYDAATQRIVVKNLILDANFLERIVFTFPTDQVIYAADLLRRRIATKTSIYDLDTFREVGTVPFTGTEHMFFDAAGTLYLVDRETGSINYLDVP